MKTFSILENKILRKLVPAVFWLLVWQIASAAIGEEILLSSPLRVFSKLVELMQTQDYWLAIATSLYKIFIGLMLSVIVGITLSVVSFYSPFFKALVHPVVIFFKSIPVAAFVIFLLMWIDSSYLSVIISFLMGMPIIYENVYEGFISTDKKLVEMAESFQVPALKRMKYMYAVKVLPYLRAGIISISGLTFKAAIAAEVIGLQRNSIGEHLHHAKIYLNMAELSAWIVTIIGLSMMFEKAIQFIMGDRHAGV